MTKKVYQEKLHAKIILLVATALMIVLAAAVVMEWYIRKTSDRVVESNYSLFSEYSQSDAYASKKELENGLSFVGAASEQFNEEPELKSSHHLKEMRYVLAHSVFSEILVCDLDGSAVTSDGTELDISDNEYFKRTVLGEDNIMLSDGSDPIDEGMLVFSAPIIYDGKIKGTIHGLYDPFTLSKIIESETLGGESYSIIVAPDGRQIIPTENNKCSLEKDENVWDMLGRSSLEKETAGEIIYNIRTENIGSFSYEYNGNKRQVFYSPLSVNGWSVLKVVTQEYIDDTLTPIRRNALLMTGIIMILLVLLAVLIIVVIVSVNRRNSLRLEEAYTHAENANAAKGRFLSRMSHEIRTPLNAVIGLTEIAKNSAGDKEKTLYTLSKIDSSSKLLLGIINDVLDMSAIENEKLKIAHEPFDIKELLDGIFTIYSPQCRQKGVELILDYSAVEHTTMIGDSLRINQIVLNLISNALKFTPEGGIIKVTASQTADGDDMFFGLRVEDNGEGMDEQMKERLFRPFEQESATTAKYHGGSGLGLSIVKSLVDMMHGAITVTSEKGRGTAFDVSLPAEFEREEHGEQGKKQESFDFTGKRCLLVEDNPMNTEIAKALLSMSGIDIEHAQNGAEAVDMFTASDSGHYDIILMDLLMPELDGFEAAARIRTSAHPDAADIPILAMSANAYTEDVSKALSVGMNGHIAKPIDTKVMFTKMAEYLFS